jgi:hypothetical protein
MVRRTDLCWLAGFLEGEGSFSYREAPRKGRPGKQRWWTIRAATTDGDVAAKAARLMGGKAYGPYKQTRSLRGDPPVEFKECWQVQLNKKSAVLALAKMLRPLMGVRRQAAIDALLGAAA